MLHTSSFSVCTITSARCGSRARGPPPSSPCPGLTSGSVFTTCLIPHRAGIRGGTPACPTASLEGCCCRAPRSMLKSRHRSASEGAVRDRVHFRRRGPRFGRFLARRVPQDGMGHIGRRQGSSTAHCLARCGISPSEPFHQPSKRQGLSHNAEVGYCICLVN